MARWRLEFEPTHGPMHVALSRDDQVIAVGHGDGRQEALWDLWTTLAHRQEREAADVVAEDYRLLTGEWPKF